MLSSEGGRSVHRASTHMQTDEQAENIMPGSGPCDGREHQNIQISLCDDFNPRLSITFKRLFAYLLRCIQTGQDSSGSVSHIRGGRGQWLGGHHGECGARAYRVWWQSPQRGPGAEPLSGGRSPPEAESILVIGCPTEPANLAPLVKLSK